MNCKRKNQLTGCCGLDCEKCDARIATLTNDNALREKTAALWTKLNGVPITGDDPLHRLPHRRSQDAVLRQALSGPSLREGKEP